MKKPWLEQYDAQVMPVIDIPNIGMTDLLDSAIHKCPDHPFIVFYGRRISYGQFNELVTQFASSLYALGVRDHSRVALVLPNIPQYVIAVWAIWQLGGIIVPLNPLYSKRELERQIKECGAETVIILDLIYPRLKVIRDNIHLKNIIIAKVKDYLPPVLRALYPFKGKKERTRIDPRIEKDLLFFSDLMNKNYPQVKRHEALPDDTAALLFTGGTTGVPKAAELSHRNLVANAYQARAWLWFMRDMEEVVMAALPLFHSYGMTCAHHIAVLIKATMVLMPKFEVDQVLHTLQKYKVTLFPGVPAMYAAINDHHTVNKFNLTSVSACVSGADTLPMEVQQKFEKLTGSKLVEGYGLSECSPVTHVNPIMGKRKQGAIGLPLPGTEARIIDPETHAPLPSGEIGELAIKGPQVMKGYWQCSDETASVFTNDGWLLTGDLGKMDDDGFFFIVDRKKDVIISGGLNVYPGEIEEVINEHPKIKEVAVVGSPDPYLGEKVKAFIVLNDNSRASVDELLDFCRARLARYKIPREIEFCSDLPKSFLGKVMRRQLAEEEKKHYKKLI